MNRTVAIVITLVTVLCCACPGFGLCLFSVLGLAGVPVTTTLNGVTDVAPMSSGAAYAMICGSLILILIPVAVGFFTLRKSKA